MLEQVQRTDSTLLMYIDSMYLYCCSKFLKFAPFIKNIYNLASKDQVGFNQMTKMEKHTGYLPMY